jgi:hypothetical protein
MSKHRDIDMKPHHLQVRIKQDDKRIWATEERPNQPLRRIRDITNDIAGCYAQILAEDGGDVPVEMWMKFADGVRVKVTIELEHGDDSVLQRD